MLKKVCTTYRIEKKFRETISKSWLFLFHKIYVTQKENYE